MNELKFTNVSASGDTFTVSEFPSDIRWPTDGQIVYRPTLDGSINLQKKTHDTREIILTFSNVKEAEYILSGSVSASGSTTSFQTSLTDYANDSFNDFYLKFTSGPYAGEEKKISDFAKANGVMTVAAFSGIPGAGDEFDIYRKADWVDTLKSMRYSVSNKQYSLSVSHTDTSASTYNNYLPESKTVIILDVDDSARVPNSQRQNIKQVIVRLRKVKD